MIPPSDVAPPAVVAHGLTQACAALAPGWPVTLLSARGAALGGGCLWWRALVGQARAAFPDTRCRDVLDCADAPGLAMGALRAGLRTLVLDPDCPAFAAVAAAAETIGGTVWRARPPALDLGKHGDARRLLAWLDPDARALSPWQRPP